MKKITYIILLMLLSNVIYAQPVNNDCANATPIILESIGSSNYTTGTFTGSTLSSLPSCNDWTAGADIWYSFVALSPGVRIYIPSQYIVDIGFEIYTTCDTTPIACVDNNGQSSSEAYYNNDFVVGQTYLVKVFTQQTVPTTSIIIFDVPTPVNDLCQNSILIPVQTATNANYTYTNIGGATESEPPCVGPVASGVWYSFIATSNTVNLYTPATSGFNPVIELFDMCGGNSISCTNSNGFDIQEAASYTTLITGNTYYVRVYGFNFNTYDTQTGLKAIDPNMYNNTGSDTVISCDVYDWNGTQYTSTGVFQQTLTNISGGDSLVSLNLTINHSTYGTDTQTACDIFTWIDGNIYTSSNNSATDTVVNSLGCDSIVTLNLTLYSINTSTSVSGNTISSNSSQETSFYQWFDCDNDVEINGQTNQSYTPLLTGNYSVIITNGPCIDTSDCININIVDIEIINEPNFISIYPNPNNGSFQVDSRGKYELNIYNLTGEKIYSKLGNDLSTVEVNLANGIYILELKSTKFHYIERLIVK